MVDPTPATPDGGTGPVVRVSVRGLAEFVHRCGGLSALVYSGLTAADGTRTHRLFFKEFEARHEAGSLSCEVPVAGEHRSGGMRLQVTGRADALLSEPDGMTLLEAKSVSADLADLPEEGEPVHWAQAMIYAHLLEVSAEAGSHVVRVALVYVSADTLEYREHMRSVDRETLRRFFEKTAETFCDWANRVTDYRARRDASLETLPFPYPNIRSGQKRFMQEALGAIRRKSPLLVQAPTGTGKTVSALYPAVKSMARRFCDRIFYLTAKTSTRFAAEKSLDDMRKCGLVMKSVSLTAKEKICLCPELYCDTRRCRFALGYYDRIKGALSDLYRSDSVKREELLATASTHGVCPFELSLDLALYSDIVIADYNYVFDPRIRLERFFGEDSSGYALLVDEAHNLPERSRGMYSASITSGRLSAARRAAVGLDPRIARSLGSVARYLSDCSADLKAGGPGLPCVEASIDAREVASMGLFRATRKKPDSLAAALWRFVSSCRDPIDALPPGSPKRALQDFFFECSFFLKIYEEFFDATYVTTSEAGPGGLAIRLMCLDASSRVRDTYLDRHSAVFFSATMSPPDYFAGLLCGPRTEDRPERLILPSPFPEENLLLLTVESVSTKYASRASSLPAVADCILAAVSQHTGNYLVYLPSFEYLKATVTAFQMLLHRESSADAFDVLVQTQGMDEWQRESFLERFSQFGHRTLVAFAVLGGVFGEGIDLVGERLSGVVVVGVGLPQLCGEREVMKDYYANVFGSGFEFAYMYPGFNKVQQAAGRVIRSDSDRGFILLVDERYGREDYRTLFPAEWHPIEAPTSEEVAARIGEFFEEDQTGGS